MAHNINGTPLNLRRWDRSPWS